MLESSVISRGKIDAPEVYAIVVNYNGWRDTIECLESLLRSDYPRLRVVVCDNASTDDSAGEILAWAQGNVSVAQPHNAELRRLVHPSLPKPLRVAVCADDQLATADAERDAAAIVLVRCRSNLGFAGANNVALKYMLSRERGGDAYALLLNNDAVIAPTAVRAMVEHAEQHDDLAAVGATILRYNRPDSVETLGGARISRLHGMVEWNAADSRRDDPRPTTVPMDFVVGCCLLAPRSTIDHVGFMDERYFLYGEDTDWCLRMRRAGLALTYCPDAEVWHKGGGTVVHRSALHDYYTVRGTLMLLHRHFPLSLPIALPHAILRFILPKLVRGEWQRLRAAARGYRDFIRYALHPIGAARS